MIQILGWQRIATITTNANTHTHHTYTLAMFKKTHWFTHWTSKPKNPLSLDHLRFLCNVMSKNNIVTEQNKTLLVETLRQIAEILIWGDQNDSSVFDFFLERNMLSFFLDIMKQKCGNYVTVQLLQTLNILFENIRHETSLYYLLSNNHVNSIIMHKFDLSDEEVMAYYISFLKTLSFKLNPHTIHFFFNGTDFPLYTEAIKYFNHPEKMVRIAVRILTLNVFKVDEKSMLKFITGQTVPCLSDLVHFIRDNVITIEKYLKESSTSSPSTPQPTTPTQSPISYDISPKTIGINNKLQNSTTSNLHLSPNSFSGGNNKNNLDKLLLRIDDLFAEHLDHLHYLNDILMLKISNINRILSDNLMHHLIKPLVDAYKDDPHNSMIRLFTLEFTTSILSKVLATSLHEDLHDDEECENINNVSDESRDRLTNDVKDCNDKQELNNNKLSSAQLAIVEQSKEIAEIKVRTLLKTDAEQQMTYLSLFDAEFNDMKNKRLTVEYLLMDALGGSSSSCKQLSFELKPAPKATSNSKANLSQKKSTNSEMNRARYQIRDFLLWRQLLLNIKNEKDRELSLKNTSWLSYAKLLQWLE
uniref:Protein CLEC16A n=1 Tax=Aceria tosichella TaxID=561515 RepID=A0A6G1S4J3_9ACAR